MAVALGLNDSGRRAAERHDPPGALSPRPERTVRYADGGLLELGPRTAVMGVLNVTPDSFSDGGRHVDPARAIECAARMTDGGADLIDVGGESTRPGAAAVDEDEEIRRVLPVIRAIKRDLEVRVAIDTRRASVAQRAFEAGADMLNDVSALGDAEMLPVVRQWRAPVVLMHMRGSPATMQQDTHYDDLLRSVTDFLRDRVARARSGGVDSDKIVVDPGLGFGKDVDGNLSILKRLSALGGLGHPILIGASRKSFIGAVLDLPVHERLEGSLAVAAFASMQGAHLIRSHDVAATVRVVRVIDAIRAA